MKEYRQRIKEITFEKLERWLRLYTPHEIVLKVAEYESRYTGTLKTKEELVPVLDINRYIFDVRSLLRFI